MRRFPSAWFASLYIFVVVLCGSAEAAAPAKAGIASAHPLATEAGLQILREGGNAFDAAIAVAAALGVVEPNSSGLGGGGFFLLHRASDGFETMVDAREVAPRAATRDMFLDKDGEPVPGLSRDSALAAGIPGEPAGFAHLAEHYGRLPLAQSLQPAIRLAEQGFSLYPRLRAVVQYRREILLTSEAAHNFLVQGAVPELGTIIKQPELAKTLRLLAKDGVDAFYKGPFAARMVKGVRTLGGIWSREDLANYKVLERRPLYGGYRGAHIVSAPPPSSGGVALINALNILSGYDLNTVDGVTRKHLIVEAMRRVHRDRAQYLGDPDFVAIPVEQLISPYYAAGQRTSIRLDKAMPSAELPGIVSGPVGPQTTHFSILDAEGNRVAATVTVNFGFGSGRTIPHTGMFLNNEMDDFSLKAGVPNGFQLVGAEANAIAPGKRRLSSMTPTFVETERGLMLIGSPGGSYIIGMVLLGTLDWLDGHDATHVVSLPRYHHQYLPDHISYEKGALTEEEKAGLEARGHKLVELRSTYGNMQVVTFDKSTREVQAASDPRGAGAGMVY